ncbi:MAG TPA: hypothetical protein DDZ51_23170 [Planctomycetaceae bacterium]|nr:hypothetical protein [Planctomycetaceae bacterium]
MNQGRKTKWIVGTAIAIVAVIVAISIRNPFGRPAIPDAKTFAVQLDLTRAALSATETLQAVTADADWDKLFQQLPDDQSVALNRALNRALHVDSLTEATSNPSLSADEKQPARAALPNAIQQARQAAIDYKNAGGDAVTELWLATRTDLQEASLLPTDAAKPLRQEIFNRLCDAIDGDLKTNPRSAILGGLLFRVLDESESPTSGIPTEMLRRGAESSLSLADIRNENLFLALRAARLGIVAQLPKSAEAVQRTKTLSRAIHPSINATTQAIGKTPDELAQGIIEAIQSGNWQTADNQMNLWFNVLNSTDLVKTDRRLATPHPLDRLDFSILRRLAYEVAKEEPIAPGQSPFSFEGTVIAGDKDSKVAIAVDIDIDLKPEIVSATDEGILSLWKETADGQWTLLDQVDTGIQCNGVLAADLFMVDTSDPNRIQASPGREGDNPLPPARHTTMLTLVAYGTDGVRIVAIDGRENTANEDRLKIIETETGLEDVLSVNAAIVGDLEGDGDLDLVVATADRGVRLFINRGNRTFFEVEQNESMASLTGVTAMAIADIDRDLDLDIVTTEASKGRIGIIENLLHLQFRFRQINEAPELFGARNIEVKDIDGNVSWDIIAIARGRALIIFSHTPEAGIWSVDRVESWKCEDGNCLLADFDNDSWFELISTRNGVATSNRLLGSATEIKIADPVGLTGKFQSAIDFNFDGKLDVLSIVDGKCHVLRNTTTPVGHFTTVRMRGIDDNNANSGRVNHYAIGSVVELRFGPHYRAQIITSPSTHFGLDGYDSASSLRVIFPNGLTQTTPQPPIDTIIEEEQTLKGSCPYLYAWDGQQFAFVTDCLWAAPLGLQVANGVVAKDRPWEYLKVDGRFVKPHNNQYELRITEELWEIAYFDHVSLVAVDHPADVDVWTNEKVGPGEIATPIIHAFSPDDRLTLRRGIDTQGRDVTDGLRSIDGQYVQGFDRRLRQGLCPPHWVDLDFGPLPDRKTASGDDAAVFLVMTGWILPTDTSLNIQIDQNPDLKPIEFPSVWVPDATEPSGWRKAIHYMGFPGGKTKTIVVDVSAAILKDDPRLRVHTSAQIYWDSAELVVRRNVPEVSVHELNLTSAVLGYRGFSRKHRPSEQSPETYDYSTAETSPKWPPLRGRFSQEGDCLSLLSEWDDAMVVMGSGDEMRLTFTVPDVELPQGWKRDFILHCVGWDKDADLNTLTGQSSEPLPFRAMTEYPPTRAHAETIDRVEAINFNHLNRRQSYRSFWYRP